MAISSLLRKLGFVRLDNYGLLLTPEGRILSVRPAVLDDGLGGKIVGWQEGDLAAMELHHWEPLAGPKPTVRTPVALAPTIPQPAVTAAAYQAGAGHQAAQAGAGPSAASQSAAGPSARAKPPTAPPPIPRGLPGMPPEATAMARPVAVAQTLAPVAASVSGPVATKRAPTPLPLETQPVPRVADSPEPGEDEWEWEIAVARARAAAEWAEEAAAKPIAAKPSYAPTPSYTPTPRPIAAPMAASMAAPMAAPISSPTAAKAKPTPIASGSEPKPVPTREASKPALLPRTPIVKQSGPTRVVRQPPPLQPVDTAPFDREDSTIAAAPLPESTFGRQPLRAKRATSPGIAIAGPVSKWKAADTQVNMAPRRFPRATPATTPGGSPGGSPGSSIGDDTAVNVALELNNELSNELNDDATRPGLLLPSVTKRVAAKER